MGEKKSKKSKNLEDIISKALKKIKGKKENDLCKYLPVEPEGYIHHFTFRRMKEKNYEELIYLIEKFILKAEFPKPICSKIRKPRSPNKKLQPILTPWHMKRLFKIALFHGDSEMAKILRPKKTLTECKRDLTQSIRECKIDKDLWELYVEQINYKDKD